MQYQRLARAITPGVYRPGRTPTIIRGEAVKHGAFCITIAMHLPDLVAHDVNNYLTGIAGFAEVARSALPDGHPVRGDLAEIIKFASRASALTSQLVTASVPHVHAPQPLDLNDLIASSEGLLRRLIGRKVSYHASFDMNGCWVCARPGQVEQVLMNLALNAAQAMPHGGALTITTARLVVHPAVNCAAHSNAPQEYAVVQISDTGTGMDTATQARVFEPFFTTKAARGGAGLGLVACKRIIQEHGGELQIVSETGQGTTVLVFLPHIGGHRLAGASKPSAQRIHDEASALPMRSLPSQ